MLQYLNQVNLNISKKAPNTGMNEFLLHFPQVSIIKDDRFLNIRNSIEAHSNLCVDDIPEQIFNPTNRISIIKYNHLLKDVLFNSSKINSS